MHSKSLQTFQLGHNIKEFSTDRQSATLKETTQKKEWLIRYIDC